MDDIFIDNIKFVFGISNGYKEIVLNTKYISNMSMKIEDNPQYMYSRRNEEITIKMEKTLFIDNLKISLSKESYMDDDIKKLISYLHIDDFPKVYFIYNNEETNINFNKIKIMFT